MLNDRRPRGRQGFKTAEDARADAERSITAKDFMVVHLLKLGGFAWFWPPEYGTPFLCDSVVEVTFSARKPHIFRAGNFWRCHDPEISSFFRRSSGRTLVEAFQNYILAIEIRKVRTRLAANNFLSST